MVLKCTSGLMENLKLFLFINLLRFEINKGCLHSQAHLLYYLGVVGLNKSNVECDIPPEAAGGVRTVLCGKHHCRLHALSEQTHGILQWQFEVLNRYTLSILKNFDSKKLSFQDVY